MKGMDLSVLLIKSIALTVWEIIIFKLEKINKIILTCIIKIKSNLSI